MRMNGHYSVVSYTAFFFLPTADYDNTITREMKKI
jgi:hypothetical protein